MQHRRVKERPRPGSRLVRAVLIALASFGIASHAIAQVHVALVLDASGSMYNRLADGRYRIDAAKAVLQGLVAGLPEDDRLHVGLRVDGARLFATDEGACEDSHLEVPVAGVDRTALARAVSGTTARGATPIVYSLELTLGDLPAAGDRRVVGRSDAFETAMATATLEAPIEVAAGTTFEVAWEGPGGPGDRIELHATAAAHRPQAPLATARTFAQPAALLAPPDPGAYELRYVTGGSGTVLASADLVVVEARVEVSVPEVVAADGVFEVAVSGAVGPRDVLVLVRAGAPDEGAEAIGPPKRLYTATVGFRAPAEPGAYEVRYLTGDGRVAQRFPVAVR